MLQGKNILVIGARAGGYGASIARAAVQAGAKVFGTSLTPADPREQAFFAEIGVTLIDIPLRYGWEDRPNLFQALESIEGWFRDRGITRLDAIIHTVAGGFPRQPSVMKAVGDILKGNQTFFDMATAVKRNVYYVNATSFEDTVKGLSGLTDGETQFLALTYRGDLPYFIAHTKKCLEDVGTRLARKGQRSLIVALPEAWTQSSQFFAGIDIAVLNNYLRDLQGRQSMADEIAPAFAKMESDLSEVQGLSQLVHDMETFRREQWSRIDHTSDVAELSRVVGELYARLRKEGPFPVLRRAVEIISDFVREASAFIVVREFLAGGKYHPGDVRQVYYRDLLGTTHIGLAAP